MTKLLNQSNIRFSLPMSAGKSLSAHKQDERVFNSPSTKTPPEKLWADFLRRQAVRVMQDITECPAVSLPAHIARLDALRETIELALATWLSDGSEGSRSAKDLSHPYTLADYLEALRITRVSHRCPVWINDREEQFQKIQAGIDRIAGLLANDPALMSVLMERGQA